MLGGMFGGFFGGGVSFFGGVFLGFIIEEVD